jgi:hypothetical protein
MEPNSGTSKWTLARQLQTLRPPEQFTLANKMANSFQEERNKRPRTGGSAAEGSQLWGCVRRGGRTVEREDLVSGGEEGGGEPSSGKTPDKKTPPAFHRRSLHGSFNFSRPHRRAKLPERQLYTNDVFASYARGKLPLYRKFLPGLNIFAIRVWQERRHRQAHLVWRSQFSLCPFLLL